MRSDAPTRGRVRRRRHPLPRARLRPQRLRRRRGLGRDRARGGGLRRPSPGSTSSRVAAATTFDDALRGVGIDPTPATIAASSSSATGATDRASSCSPTPGGALDGLRAGRELAVVTDGPLASQRAKAEALGVDRLGRRCVVFTERARSRLRQAASPRLRADRGAHVGGPRSDCVYMADNPAKDFAGPKPLGWRTVRVRRPESAPRRSGQRSRRRPRGHGSHRGGAAPRVRRRPGAATRDRPTTVAHLTTVDSSLRYLLLPAAPRGRATPAVTRSGSARRALRSPARGATASATSRCSRRPAAWTCGRPARRARAVADPAPGARRRAPHPQPQARALRPGRRPAGRGADRGQHRPRALRRRRRRAGRSARLVYALEGVAARFSDAELVQNPEDLELLTRLATSPAADAARLLGNGVDLTRFDPARLRRRSGPRSGAELGVGPTTVVVGTVGRLVAEKGYPELFEAAGTLRRALRRRRDRARRPGEARRPRRGCVDARPAPTGSGSSGMRDDVDRALRGAWTCSCCRRIVRASPGRRWRPPPWACRSSPPTSAAAGRSSTTA